MWRARYFFRQNWGGFVPLFAWVIWATLAIVGDADFIIQFVAGRSEIGKMLKTFLVDYPLILPLVVIAWTATFIVVRLGKEEKKEERRFVGEWNRLKRVRRDFEDKISSLYENWSGDDSDPNAIKDIVEKAGFPAGLPLKSEEEEIWQYAEGSLFVWKGDRRTLSDFCSVVYIRKDNRLLPTRDEWVAFDDMRMDLSKFKFKFKFWNVWAEKCFYEKAMDERKMVTKVPGQEKWMIPLLIYLEIARAYHYRSPGPGKHWLFQLGRMVARQ